MDSTPNPKPPRRKVEKDLISRFHKKQANLQRLRAEQNLRMKEVITGVPRINLKSKKIASKSARSDETVIANQSVLNISVNLLSVSSSQSTLRSPLSEEKLVRQVFGSEKEENRGVNRDLGYQSTEKNYKSLTPGASKVSFKSGCDLNQFLTKAKPMVDYKTENHQG